MQVQTRRSMNKLPQRSMELAAAIPTVMALLISWSQSSGASITITNANSAQASFDAPNVGIGSSAALTFQLRVTDSVGAIDSDTVDIVVNGVSNTDPVTDAGANQATTEAATVNLSGTASDGDIGDTLSYSWTQLSGTAVTITNNDMANASFVAPDVDASGDTLTLQLAVNDGTVTVTDTLDVAVSEAAVSVTVSGKVFYEFVPPNAGNCNGSEFQRDSKRDRFEQRRSSSSMHATGNVLDYDGCAQTTVTMRLTMLTGNLDVRIARTRRTQTQRRTPGWDVEVRDNVDTSANPATARQPSVVRL